MVLSSPPSQDVALLSVAPASADRPAPVGPAAVAAPPALTLSGSVRLRYEALGGQVRPGVGRGEDVTVLRTILSAEYRVGRLRFGGELYDSRAYGADRGGVLSTTDVDALEPVQAYVAADLGRPFGPGSSAAVQLGRMTLNLGSRRLVAADDYRNTTSGYTGLRFDAKSAHGKTLTLIYVAPQVRLPEDTASLRANRVRLDTEGADLLLWGGVAAMPLPGKAVLELEYFGLAEKDAPGRPTRNRDLDSYGARLVRAPQAGRLDYELEAIAQTGTIRASLDPAARTLGVSAGFVHAEAGYQFAAAWKPRLSLEYDWASGDRGGGRYNRFDTLYGFRRADFAPSGILSDIGRANVDMPGVRLEVTPGPRLDGFVHYALMWLASPTDAFSTSGVRDPAGNSGRFAGGLLEGRVRYWIVPGALRLELNGALIAKGRFLETAPNAPRTGDTAYGSAAMTVSF
ncbi:MAG TPA: alginate export family protein [Caulobacteraceae bacterium]|nr:alginate export family protein [Caulobacteraceae bacterium]